MACDVIKNASSQKKISAGEIEVYTSQSIVSTHKTLYILIYTVMSMFHSAITIFKCSYDHVFFLQIAANNFLHSILLIQTIYEATNTMCLIIIYQEFLMGYILYYSIDEIDEILNSCLHTIINKLFLRTVNQINQ